MGWCREGGVKEEVGYEKEEEWEEEEEVMSCPGSRFTPIGPL